MRGLKRLDREHHRHEPKSHLLQMRGLKLNAGVGAASGLLSHLLQMRGLKLTRTQEFFRNATSHLLQMRGLKLALLIPYHRSATSHLLQMRGLKPTTSLHNTTLGVASFTDAWIETISEGVTERPETSHLLQMRGLKLMFN